MTLPTGKLPAATSARVAPAFTLVELILVMALLTVVLALAAPTLSGFVRGRALQEEAGRFLALTRYGQARAVSQGVPMVLWINSQEGTYGLWKASAYSADVAFSLLTPEARSRLAEEKPLDFKLAKALVFQIDPRERLTNGVALIRFAPDGSIDETSLTYLEIEDPDRGIVPIAQARNRLHYEITDTNTLGADLAP